jgi:Domain of unknown function (DUF5664)
MTQQELGIRENQGKPKWSLVDFDALVPMVRVLEYGSSKYHPDNWKKGLKYTEVSESLLRHVFAFLDGEDNDPESKLLHVGHILSNAMFLSYMSQYRHDMDNRRIDKAKAKCCGDWDENGVCKCKRMIEELGEVGLPTLIHTHKL